MRHPGGHKDHGPTGFDPAMKTRMQTVRSNIGRSHDSEWLLLLDVSGSMGESCKQPTPEDSYVRRAGLDVLCIAGHHDSDQKMQQVYFNTKATQQGTIALRDYGNWLTTPPQTGGGTHLGAALRLAVEVGAKELRTPRLATLVDPRTAQTNTSPLRRLQRHSKMEPGEHLTLPRPLVIVVITDGNYQDAAEVERVMWATRNTGACIIAVYASNDHVGLNNIKNLALRYPNFHLLNYEGGLKTLRTDTFTTRVSSTFIKWVDNVARPERLILN